MLYTKRERESLRLLLADSQKDSGKAILSEEEGVGGDIRRVAKRMGLLSRLMVKRSK